MLRSIPMPSTALPCVFISSGSTLALVLASTCFWLVVSLGAPRICAKGVGEDPDREGRAKGARDLCNPEETLLGGGSVVRGESPALTLGSPLRLRSRSNGFSLGGLERWECRPIYKSSITKHKQLPYLCWIGDWSVIPIKLKVLRNQ